MRLVDFLCSQCRKVKQVRAARISQAFKKGLPMYCSRECGGLARRKDNPVSPRNANWKALKSAYDADYRIKNKERLKAEKAVYYQATANREKEREYRKKNMPRHVEYCRQPEYRAKKSLYDKDHRNRKFYGEFAEAAALLHQLQVEIRTRIDKYEIYALNGTLNKKLQRRREYERQSKQPHGS